jgi:hypothetical protein
LLEEKRDSAIETLIAQVEAGAGWNDAGPLRRDVVVLPEVPLDSFSADVPALMRPVFNTLWNAFGFPECDMYMQGKWRGVS